MDAYDALRTYSSRCAAMGSGDPAAVAVGRSMPSDRPDELIEASSPAPPPTVAWNGAWMAQAEIRRAARFHETYDAALPCHPHGGAADRTGRRHHRADDDDRRPAARPSS
jgi:hypothetical protein